MTGGPPAVSAAELEADRWVLLRPATRRWTWGWRAAVLVLLAVTGAGVVLGGALDLALPRSGWRWAVLLAGLAIALAGAGWGWWAAALPRSIDTEVRRLLGPAATHRRRLARALRDGEPLHGTDRPAAAAYAAGLQVHRQQPGPQLIVAGMLLAFAADTADGVLAWCAPGIYLVAACVWLAAAGHAHRMQRAVRAAGLAPRVGELS